MNPIGALSKLAQKPSNAKIRMTRFIFALLLTAVIIFGFQATDINISIFDYVFVDFPDEYNMYILPVLFVFPFIGFVRAIFDPGLFRKAIWKKVITTCGLLMMIFSVFFLSEKSITPPVQTVAESQSVTPETIKLMQQSANNDYIFAMVSMDNWMFFFGFLVFFAGFFLNNKNITTKNEKFGEKITIIQV